MPPAATRQQAFQKLQHKSLKMFSAFSSELAEFGQCETGYQQCGRLDLLRTEQIRKMAQAECAAAADYWPLVDGLPAQQILEVDELLALQPRLKATEFGAL